MCRPAWIDPSDGLLGVSTLAVQIPTLALQSGGPLLPAWFVLPVALVVLVLVAGHWIALGRMDMPPARRSIRSANGLVMMLAIPVLASGFGIVGTERPRTFVLTWMLASGLLLLVLLLALLDMAYTWRLALGTRRALRDELRSTQERAGAASRATPAGLEAKGEAS